MTQSLAAAAFAGVVAATGPLFAQQAAAAGDANGDGAFKDGKYVLPPLPYDYAALEPHIDADTMKLHHDKHHAAYVAGANKAIDELAKPDLAPALLTGLQEDLSFNVAGHVLHTLFWKTLAPKAGGEPSGAIAEAIKKDFGAVEAFRTHFSKVAAGVKGSGWAILVHEPVADRLMIVQAKQHDLQQIPGATPLLPLDVWEHAYYLKYHNVRADYIKAWWNVVNWPAVDAALAASRKA